MKIKPRQSGSATKKSESFLKYKLVYHPRAVKFLKKLPLKEKRRVVSKIASLEQNPHSEVLDIKKLTTTSRSFRLRVGTIRVIFEVGDDTKTIYINEVDFRGNVY